MLSPRNLISPRIALALVSFSLGELGDGLNVIQGVYLVAIGWSQSSVGIALSFLGLTEFIVQTMAGDVVDKTSFDIRHFLALASIAAAVCASMVLFLPNGNSEHMLIFISDLVQGVANSFITPCLSALTLASFGPDQFDDVMANNILWGHVGSVVMAIAAGLTSYFCYPHVKYCFLVIAASALIALLFMKYLPYGDPKLRRGFVGAVAMTPEGTLVPVGGDPEHLADVDLKELHVNDTESQTAHTYWMVFSDQRSYILCISGLFFQFANANVQLVLGELMGGDNPDGSVKRIAIPMIAAAVVISQLTMTVATFVGGWMTVKGMGRKPLFLIGLLSLPLRCALIVYWREAGDAYLLSTQILDGVGCGLIFLIQPFLVADITFGTGRFNVLMGLTYSFWGLGATLSNILGQLIAQDFGYIASIEASFLLSIFPLVLFWRFMPETMGQRGLVATGEQRKPIEADDDDFEIVFVELC